jgi:putative transcriptional regulator
VIIIKLAKILDERQISHREFSRMSGIRHPSVSAMCNNDVKHIPLDNLDAICNTLGCNVEDIIEHKSNPGK